MRVALITPWDNAWVPMYREEVERRGHEFAVLKKPEPANFDVVLHGWAHDKPMSTGARNLMFLRRYELFEGVLERVNWNAVDRLVCVNSWIEKVVGGMLERLGVKTPVSTVYNAVDTRAWTFKEHKPGKRIGMACHIHPKKNLPLALQILAALPEDYELHIAGAVQDTCTAEYLNHLGQFMRRRVYLYGHIDRGQLDEWWGHMHYCLSTSLSEGNPNNVIEAMAKGIKPVVHRWPGAEDQFPAELLFSTVEGAKGIIQSGSYASIGYRQHVDLHYSTMNIRKVVDLALETA